jgi:hypothetical protein
VTRLANVAGTCGIAPHVERLVLAEQVTIALADLATAVRDGLVESDAEGGRRISRGQSNGVMLFRVCAGQTPERPHYLAAPVVALTCGGAEGL